MYVRLFNNSCVICHNKVPSIYVDLPIKEIKLHSFPVQCACGYFYEAMHTIPSFFLWLKKKHDLEDKIKAIKNEINQEAHLLLQFPDSKSCADRITKLELTIKELTQEVQGMVNPIPNDLIR